MQRLPFQFHTSNFELKDLEWNQLSNTSPRDFSVYSDTTLLNDEGIVGRNLAGQQHHHPVRVANQIITRIENYSRNNDERYLNTAIDHAEHAISTGIRRGDATYFPYSFEWHLHGLAEAKMSAPWFSAMAQGHLLRAFCRLFVTINNDRYLEYAHRIFESFLLLPDGESPWTTTLTDDGFVWFEEYAQIEGPTDWTYNGHIYAIYGLYEYWWVTKDERAKSLIDGGMTSIIAHMDNWRAPGDMSFYCMAHRSQLHNYHSDHIHQIGTLYSYTGHPIWTAIQDTFQLDYPLFSFPRVDTDTLVIEPGTYVVGGHGDMTVETRIEVTHAEQTRLPVNLRGRLRGETGIYCRTRQEDIGTRQYPEIPDRVYLEGVREELTWIHPRSLILQTPTQRLIRFDQDGSVIEESIAKMDIGSHIKADKQALLRGQRWYHIVEGSAKDWWIPLSNVQAAESF